MNLNFDDLKKITLEKYVSFPVCRQIEIRVDLTKYWEFYIVHILTYYVLHIIN